MQISNWKIFYNSILISYIKKIFTGDLLNEDEVLSWLIEQKNTATIEEVTDEILSDLIEEHEYVVVYFSKWFVNNYHFKYSMLVNSLPHYRFTTCNNIFILLIISEGTLIYIFNLMI